MDRVAFTIFGIPIMWYAIMVTTAIICAFFLYIYIAKKAKIDEDFILESFIWVVVLAVIGCRLGYVMFDSSYYPLDSWEAIIEYFNIRDGGLTIIGGIFGGALGLYLCCLRNKKYSFAKVGDCIVVALLLGQIIGRWGNFFNQELYGMEILNPAFQRFPFAVYINEHSGWFAASFFYEGCLNTIGLIAALFVTFKYKDKVKPFVISLGYIVWYGIVRGCLEFIKYEKAEWPNSNIGIIQTICFVASAIGIVVMILLQLGYIKVESEKFKKKCEINLQKIQEKKALLNRTSYPNGIVLAPPDEDCNNDCNKDNSSNDKTKIDNESDISK